MASTWLFKKRVFRLYGRICGWLMLGFTTYALWSLPFNASLLITCGIGIMMAFGHYLFPLLGVPMAKKYDGRLLSFEFTSDGYRIWTDGFDASVAWHHVLEILTGDTGYFICLAKMQGIWLPKHAFASETDAKGFLTLVNEAKVKVGTL
jgi:hypothetical protein